MLLTPQSYVRPTPGLLRQAFALASPDKIASLPKLPGKVGQNVLTVGTTFTTLFDHGYRGEGGLEDFHRFMAENAHVPMMLKPEAMPILSLLDPNYLTEDGVPRPFTKLRIYSRFSGSGIERLLHSLKHYGFETDIQNDFIMLSLFSSEGLAENDLADDAIARTIKENGDVDFVYLGPHKMALGEKINRFGVGAGLLIENPGVTGFDPLEPALFATDIDGTFLDDTYEIVFQKIFHEMKKKYPDDMTKALKEAKAVYYDLIERTWRENTKPGPTLNLFRGLSLIANLFDRNADPNKPAPWRTKAITARDVRGAVGFEEFALRHHVKFDTMDFLSGNPKPPLLVGATKYFEDDMHYLRRTYEMPVETRPPVLVYIPHGVKHERAKAGLKVVTDGRSAE